MNEQQISSTLKNLFDAHLIQPPKNLNCVDDKKDAEWEVNFDVSSAFLGPTLWSKTLTYDGDLKLDYMDLDVFLSEDNASQSNTNTSSSQLPIGKKILKTENNQDDRDDESKSSTDSSDSEHEGVKVVPKVELGFSPEDLALALAPGQTNFDPTSHKFTEDELKPQPMYKKSKKQFVPSDLKDEKYWSRRKKNNMAAKRSRDARRIKENQIALRAQFLEKENNSMKKQLFTLRNENALLLAKIDSLIQ